MRLMITIEEWGILYDALGGYAEGLRDQEGLEDFQPVRLQVAEGLLERFDLRLVKLAEVETERLNG